MKKLYTLGFALIVLLSMIMSAAALESKTIIRQNGVSAHANWFDGTNSTSLSVIETNDRTDIFVSISTPTTHKFGSLSTQQDVFNIDKARLTSATLSPVQVPLFNTSTGELVETITIEAEWIGVGDLTKNSAHSISKFEGITLKFSDNAEIRSATATGSINGTDLGTSSSADMIKFRSASITMEK